MFHVLPNSHQIKIKVQKNTNKHLWTKTSKDMCKASPYENSCVSCVSFKSFKSSELLQFAFVFNSHLYRSCVVVLKSVSVLLASVLNAPYIWTNNSCHQFHATMCKLLETQMKIRVFFNCTPQTDRKRIKVIVSHPVPHIGQNDGTNQSKGTDSEVCQEQSDR